MADSTASAAGQRGDLVRRQHPGYFKGWKQKRRQQAAQEGRKRAAAERAAASAPAGPVPAPPAVPPAAAAIAAVDATAPGLPTAAAITIINTDALPLTARFRAPDCDTCGDAVAVCQCVGVGGGVVFGGGDGGGGFGGGGSGGGGGGGGGDDSADCPPVPMTSADLRKLIMRAYETGRSGGDSAPPQLRVVDGFVTLLIDETRVRVSASDKVWYPCTCRPGWNARDAMCRVWGAV